MKRLRRILLNALTVLSLLLCLASAALWVRSYWRNDLLTYIHPATPGEETFAFVLGTGRGGVAIGTGLIQYGSTAQIVPDGWHWRSDDRRPTPYAYGSPTGRWGFSYASVEDPSQRGTTIVFPAWLAATLFAALPLARGALFVRRRRRGREGHCKKCGYDLRATPDRCPECGTIPAQA